MKKGNKNSFENTFLLPPKRRSSISCQAASQNGPLQKML